mmetsp:Transcript_33536/g.71567  ORF Transcript_33536/g.71567 Transcript_33536/m.71567 type:complete len:222 (-) Transcript_33536:142-807(-)
MQLTTLSRQRRGLHAQHIQLKCCPELGAIVAATDDNIGECVLHQELLREGIPNSEGVPLRGLDALLLHVLNAADPGPGNEFLACSVPPEEVDREASTVLKHDRVRLSPARPHEWRLLAVDELWLGTRARFNLNHSFLVLQQQHPIACLPRTNGTRTPDVPAKGWEVAARARSEDGMWDLISIFAHIQHLCCEARSIAEVQVLRFQNKNWIGAGAGSGRADH